MNESIITILGEELTIGFNMAVEIAFEEIAGIPFNTSELDTQKNSMALYMAAILTFNPKTKITFKDLVMKASASEINTLGEAVINAMKKWMAIPDVVDIDEKPKDDDEKPKN